MDMDWKTILANGALTVLLAVAYAIREWVNGWRAERERIKADEDRARIETKIDGNTALCATTLVSSGNLPKAAPCIPAVAKAISQPGAATSACEYVATATAEAHDTMEREGIPIQSQDLLVKKLHAMLVETQKRADKAEEQIEDTQEQVEEARAAEKRHNENNMLHVKGLHEALDKMKADMAALKAEKPE